VSEDVVRTVELVRLAQGGDRSAFEALFARYYDRVQRIVRMRLGSKLRARVEVDDILHETFAVAVARFDRFEMRDQWSLINWLAKLAERQILAAADYHGARKRDAEREIPLSPAPTDASDSSSISKDLAASVDAPIETLSAAEQVAIVEACITELPEEYREVIILREYAEASWDAVAAETRRPTAAAARMMHARALVELGRLVRARSRA
jgi:RNA polymerase sigma-70 factor (ECF subfamily)